MGWLQRLFGKEEEERANTVQTAPQSQSAKPASTQVTPPEAIPPERVGLDGQYDQSGLAKRVALAFDRDSAIDDIETLWVAQAGSTVVLKGQVPDRETLDKMVAVARGINGATAVDTEQVTVG